MLKNPTWRISAIALTASFLANTAVAGTMTTAEAIKKFATSNDPAELKAVMDREIPTVGGKPGKKANTPDLSKASLAKMVETKDAQRKKMIKGRAPVLANDAAVNLVDNQFKELFFNEITQQQEYRLKYRTLQDMETAGLREAPADEDGSTMVRLEETPWSSDYWAIYKGGLAYRYAEGGAPTDWPEVRDTFIRETYERNDETGERDFLFAEWKRGPVNASSIDTLSPAEKYDLLVGGADFHGMTIDQVGRGRPYYNKDGSVQGWMGICHGWSPAAYMEKRPREVVMAKSPEGFDIPFYPADLRALASLMWAEASPWVKFIGGRCNVQDPAKDPTTGRIKNSKCFDNNPASFHLAMVNQIGSAHIARQTDKSQGMRSLVLDVTYDYQVWNQPAYGYKYTYFNPKSGEQVAELKDALVEYDDPTFTDKFKDVTDERGIPVRSRDLVDEDGNQAVSRKPIKWLAGVAMTVEYGLETHPDHEKTHSKRDDSTTTKTWLYDLEIAEDGELVGGEWWQNSHPDFLWTPGENDKAAAFTESYITNYNPNTPIDASVIGQDNVVRIKAAAEQSRPTLGIIKGLIEASQVPQAQ